MVAAPLLGALEERLAVLARGEAGFAAPLVTAWFTARRGCTRRAVFVRCKGIVDASSANAPGTSPARARVAGSTQDNLIQPNSSQLWILAMRLRPALRANHHLAGASG